MTTIVPPVYARPVAPSIGMTDRAARAVVLRGLRGLQEGNLVLTDPIGTVTVGRDTGPGGLSGRVTIVDPRFWRLVAAGGSLGAAEAWINGLWDSDDLTTVLRLFVRNAETGAAVEAGFARLAAVAARAFHWVRRNTRRGSRRNIQAHYDLGNALFELMLDHTMTYSSAIFDRPGMTLAEAQIEKLDRLCRKLNLGPDDHVLEIGTGWGSFALHAAKQYGCRVTTTTISREQHELARQRVRNAGLEERITLVRTDYRDLRGRYDKLVSIEMIEAVGHKFLDGYFAACSGLLADDGLMALQAITMPDRGYEAYLGSVDFIQRYVFPGSCLPSLGSMTRSVARATDLRITDVEDITGHYVTTLQHWRDRFVAATAEVRRLGYPESFIRLWHYYLCYCEAGFAERYIGDVQIVLAKPRHDVDEVA